MHVCIVHGLGALLQTCSRPGKRPSLLTFIVLAYAILEGLLLSSGAASLCSVSSTGHTRALLTSGPHGGAGRARVQGPGSCPTSRAVDVLADSLAQCSLLETGFEP